MSHENHKHKNVKPYYVGPQGFDIYRNGKVEKNLRHNPWWYEEYVFENLIASDNREVFVIGPHATDALFSRSDLKSIAVPDSLVFHRVNQVWTLIELWEFKSAPYYKPQEKINNFYHLLRHIHLHNEDFFTYEVANLVNTIPSHDTLFYNPGERLLSPDPRNCVIAEKSDFHSDFELEPNPSIHIIFINPYCELAAPKYDPQTNFLVSHIPIPWIE